MRVQEHDSPVRLLRLPRRGQLHGVGQGARLGLLPLGALHHLDHRAHLDAQGMNGSNVNS